MRYEDTEIDPSQREEQEREEAEREFARRVRREVRRINSGEADDQMAEEEREEREREAAKQAEREKQRRRSSRTLRLLFTGSILTKDEIRRSFPYLVCVAAMFFLSIFILFSALRLDIRRSRLQEELKLLHEKSVRQSELLYRSTSRQAVIEQSQARGLNLQELPTQTFIIEAD